MNILKKSFYVAFAFLLTACGSENPYWNALPEQSAAVVSIDLPRLATRAGFTESNGEAGVKRVQEMIKSGLEGSGQLVDRLFADASESGVDFKAPIYLFSTEENAIFGLLAKVTSDANLEEVLKAFQKEQLCQAVRETDGCRWTVLGKWLLAYSDDALLVLSDNKWSDPSKLVRQASMWLRQQDGQGFAAKSDFQQLQQTESDVSLWTSLHLLPRKVITPLTMGLSAEMDVKKIKAITTLNFEEGKVVMDILPLVADPIMRKLMDRKATSLGQLKGHYMDEFPSNTTFWTTLNIKGADFYQFLREIPAVRKFFDHSDLPVTIDYGRIFNAIEGDVAFAVTDPYRGDFIFFADVKQTEFLNVFTELRPMIAKSNGMLMFKETGENAYCFATHDGSVMNMRPGPKIFWLGVKNGRFYFTNKEDLIDRRVLGLSLRNKEWGKRVPGETFFAMSTWNGMRAFEYFLQMEVLKALPKAVPDMVDHLTIESVDGKTLRVILNQKDEKKNLVRLLVNP